MIRFCARSFLLYRTLPRRSFYHLKLYHLGAETFFVENAKLRQYCLFSVSTMPMFYVVNEFVNTGSCVKLYIGESVCMHYQYNNNSNKNNKK